MNHIFILVLLHFLFGGCKQYIYQNFEAITDVPIRDIRIMSKDTIVYIENRYFKKDSLMVHWCAGNQIVNDLKLSKYLDFYESIKVNEHAVFLTGGKFNVDPKLSKLTTERLALKISLMDVTPYISKWSIKMPNNLNWKWENIQSENCYLMRQTANIDSNEFAITYDNGFHWKQFSLPEKFKKNTEIIFPKDDKMMILFSKSNSGYSYDSQIGYFNVGFYNLKTLKLDSQIVIKSPLSLSRNIEGPVSSITDVVLFDSTYFVLGHIDWKAYLWKINPSNFNVLSVELLNTPKYTVPSKFLSCNEQIAYSAFEFVTYNKKNANELFKDPSSVFDIILYKSKTNSKFKSYRIGKYDKNQAVGSGLVAHNEPNSFSLISYRIKPK